MFGVIYTLKNVDVKHSAYTHFVRYSETFRFAYAPSRLRPGGLVSL